MSQRQSRKKMFKQKYCVHSMMMMMKTIIKMTLSFGQQNPNTPHTHTHTKTQCTN